MKKTIPKLLTLVCLLAALMGLSAVTAHAETISGTISGGRNYHYYEDKSNVPQWGPFISTKLKYFTRSDTGKTVPAYCMEPAAASSGSALGYSSVSWSALSWNQRYAVTLALAYGHGGSYTFDMNPDYAQLATQAIIWEFVCGYRSPTYPYTLHDTTCHRMFRYVDAGVGKAYDTIIDRMMQHGKLPSFAVRYRNQLSESNAIELDWDGSRYTGTVTDTNGVLSQYSFGCNISGVTIRQEGNTLTVTATKEAAEKLDGYVSSEKGYSLDVDGTEAVLLEPSNGSNFQSCAALTTLPDPVWAYIQFKVNKVGSISVRKVDAAGEALAGAEFLLETSADGQSWTEVGSVTTGADGLAQWENLKTGVQYRITEAKAPVGYTLLPEPVEVGMLTADAADITITLCNNAGFELPFTGGTGFTTYFLLAALMLCMGVYFCKNLISGRRTTEHEKEPSHSIAAAGGTYGHRPHDHGICRRAYHQHRQESVPEHLQVRYHHGQRGRRVGRRILCQHRPA